MPLYYRGLELACREAQQAVEALVVALTWTRCRNRRLPRTLGQHPQKGSLHVATSLRVVDHVPEPSGFQVGVIDGLAALSALLRQEGRRLEADTWPGSGRTPLFKQR